MIRLSAKYRKFIKKKIQISGRLEIFKSNWPLTSRRKITKFLLYLFQCKRKPRKKKTRRMRSGDCRVHKHSWESTNFFIFAPSGCKLSHQEQPQRGKSFALFVKRSEKNNKAERGVYLESEERRCIETDTAPALSPNNVTFSGLPPNAAMLSLTHCSAIT